MLAIAKINIEAGTQTRVGINEDVVKAYAAAMKDGEEFPPVVVFFDGTDYILADGFHRVLAASRNRFREIAAKILKGTRLDALKYALRANRCNGLYRSNADKRRCVEIALQEFPELSDRKIAELVGVSHPFVSKVKDEVVTVTTQPDGGDSENAEESSDCESGIDIEDEVEASVDDHETESDPAEETDAAPQTTEDRMKAWNRQVESFALSITKLAKEAPEGGWWDESQANITTQQLKSAAGSARQAKCDNICPKCSGKGCDWCKQTGFMPKRTYEMCGGK